MKPESIGSISIEEKVGQLFIIGLPGPQLDEAALSLLNDVSPGGVCLFSRNIREAAQTRELLDGIRENSNVEPILCIDQEGGLVDRLRRVLAPMPSVSSLRTNRDAARHGEITAAALRIFGLNLDFAPVVDVTPTDGFSANNGLFSRTFGGSPSDAAAMAGSFLSALQAGGCLGCLKHFPGLGATSVDSHEELPVVEATFDELLDADLLPYQKLLPIASAVMVAHAAYPNVYLQERAQNGKLLPSSLSPAFVTELLRKKLGFDGVVITDDLEMGAIAKNYGTGEACRMAITAGIDMLAICADPNQIREGHAAVLESVKDGRISEARVDESLERIGVLKKRLSPAAEFDFARLAAISNEIELLKKDLN